MLAELFIEYTDGAVQRINTDDKFKSNTENIDGWLSYDYDDSAWERVLLQAAPPASPWNKKLAYIDFSSPQKFIGCEYENKTYDASSLFNAKIKFQGNVPELPICRGGKT